MNPQRTYDDLTPHPSELATWEERWRRAAADLANYRKRAARELVRQRQQEREAVLQDWLPVLDNLDRALSHLDHATHEGLVDGLQAVRQQAAAVLERYGVRRMHTLNECFDPGKHEAIASVPGEPEGVILDEVAPGYHIGETTLRAAQVIVASGQPTEEGHDGL